MFLFFCPVPVRPPPRPPAHGLGTEGSGGIPGQRRWVSADIFFGISFDLCGKSTSYELATPHFVSPYYTHLPPTLDESEHGTHSVYRLSFCMVKSLQISLLPTDRGCWILRQIPNPPPHFQSPTTSTPRPPTPTPQPPQPPPRPTAERWAMGTPLGLVGPSRGTQPPGCRRRQWGTVRKKTRCTLCFPSKKELI